MAEVTINNSPIHSDTILSAVYGETGPYWARFHTGIDFVAYGETPAKPDLFSVCRGYVHTITFDNTLGNQIVIADDDGKFWRYCHMNERSNLNEGDRVTTQTKVGVMGETGNVTGIHLHLECETSPIWSYDYFLNPSTELGIPNERGTIVHYEEITPPTPTTEIKKHNFNWPVFTKTIRAKRTFL